MPIRATSIRCYRTLHGWRAVIVMWGQATDVVFDGRFRSDARCQAVKWIERQSDKDGNLRK